MRKKKKKRVEKYITPREVSEKTPPQSTELTNHNARNLSLVETESLSGGLCGRQALPYRH